MKKELQYFRIEETLGGNQSLLSDFMMRAGGCAAVTACDLCIHLELFHTIQKLYPFDIHNLSQKEYNQFVNLMKTYLRPRLGGITKLQTYTDGLSDYLKSMHIECLAIRGYSGDEAYEGAIKELKGQVDRGSVIPFLLLRHKKARFKNLTWHWFLLAGYQQSEEDVFVKVITYGQEYWVSFSELWNTGFRKKGGMILVEKQEQNG